MAIRSEPRRGCHAAQAKNIADELNNSYPLATLNMDVFSPMIQTAIAELHRPATEEVTEMMKPALPYGI
ncbi:MAG TPA: hypothetical protein VGU63_13060 [Candidatus Acidoferrales bacterium]|nr:hypothetical protein [Candidatus Acidoferrales bacterium]